MYVVHFLSDFHREHLHFHLLSDFHFLTDFHFHFLSDFHSEHLSDVYKAETEFCHIQYVILPVTFSLTFSKLVLDVL